ncbi:hypothetical protein DFP72DRAFT_897202 [Ephemerocybe angulata]|uniref:Uncharacterized protein n=1 Tax=Ephemerocybe angulata TaxID=980116 RepID=A0A8H6I0E7_9AGAR|nr:hypothetical protein DFP72DRAFT_897202 [Tulosesus angulatus]
MPGLGAISPRWTRLRYYMSVYRYANHCHVVYAMELWDGEPPTRTASSMSPGLGHWNSANFRARAREPHQPALQHGGPNNIVTRGCRVRLAHGTTNKANNAAAALQATSLSLCAVRYPATPAHHLQQPNGQRQPETTTSCTGTKPNDDGLHNDAGDATFLAPLSTFDARIGECRPSAPMPTHL